MYIVRPYFTYFLKVLAIPITFYTHTQHHVHNVDTYTEHSKIKKTFEFLSFWECNHDREHEHHHCYLQNANQTP